LGVSLNVATGRLVLQALPPEDLSGYVSQMFHPAHITGDGTEEALYECYY